MDKYKTKSHLMTEITRWLCRHENRAATLLVKMYTFNILSQFSCKDNIYLKRSTFLCGFSARNILTVGVSVW